MRDAIHYIGTAQLTEHQHLHHPITSGKLPADEVVLIHSEEEDPLYHDFHTKLGKKFSDANIDVREETIGRYEIHEDGIQNLFRLATSEVEKNLEAGIETYVNAASHPIALGYCFLYATEMLAIGSGDSLGGLENQRPPSDIRQQTHLYITRGSSYLGDILHALDAFSKIKPDLERIYDRQSTLLSDMQQQTESANTSLRAIKELMGTSEDGTEKWRQTVEKIENTHSEQGDNDAESSQLDDSITEDIERIFEGLKMVGNGLSNFADNEFRKGILTSIDGDKDSGGDALYTLLSAIDEIDEVDDSQSSDSTVLPTLLQHRVADIEDSLDQLNFWNQEISQIIEENQLYWSMHDEISEDGISFSHSYYPLPYDPGDELNDMETAILATIAVGDEVDSITELIDNLIRLSLEIVIGDIDESDQAEYSSELLSIYQEYLDQPATPSDSREKVIDGLRSKVQYNLDNLAEKNLVQKVKRGRNNEISLTMPGQLLSAAKGYENTADLEESDRIHSILESIVDDVLNKLR